MARKESVPTAQTHNAATPRASYEKHVSHDDSPPRTPPSQINRIGKSKGVGGVRAPRNRPALSKDTFNDQARDNADEDVNSHRDRSSHDLSWSPRNTRDSVVDNMLLSLDQFSAAPLSHGSTGAQTLFDGDAPFGQGQPYPVSIGRPRGHTYSSSVSSEFTAPLESPLSTSNTRGHRSNSSTNFQSTLGRIDSIRLTSDDKTKGASHTQDLGPGAGKASNGPASARKGSKSSGSSSLDFGQIMGGPRWSRAVARRSSSFDHGYNRPTFVSPTITTPMSAPFPITTRDSFDYDNLDAAPTPTVPVGPRRAHSPPPSTFRPSSSLSSSQAIPLRRRGSMRSPIAFFGRNESHQDSRKSSRAHTRTSSRDQNNPTLVTSPMNTDSIPTPSNQHPSYTTMPREKERPGFFKRVFGSSKNSSVTQNDFRSDRRINSFAENSARSGSRTESQPSKPNNKPVKNDSGTPSGSRDKQSKEQAPPPTLNKKSSFFRRRKKSFSEQPAPAVPQIQTMWQEQAPLPAPQIPQDNDAALSPVSSLRKVMHPYLDSPTRIDNSIYAEQEGQGKEFHGRTGSYNQSTIRAVRPIEDKETIELPSLRDTHPARRNLQDEAFSTRKDSLVNLKENKPSSPLKANENDRPTPSKSHLRTQSDVDKELPKLPSEQEPKDVTTVDSSKPALIATPIRTSSRDPIKNFDRNTPAKNTPKSVDSSDSTPRPRLRLNPSDSEVPTSIARLSPTGDKNEDPRTSGSTLSDYKSANSKVQSPTTSPIGETMDIMPSEADLAAGMAGLSEILESPTAADEPSEEDNDVAKKLFDGESDMAKGDIASWLGELGPERAKVRKAYMRLFDWQNLNILAALRSFCGHLKLKGESQQVDRLLDSMSSRWCECNPNHGFKATGKFISLC